MNNAVKKYSAVVDLWFLNSVFGVIIVCNLISMQPPTIQNLTVNLYFSANSKSSGWKGAKKTRTRSRENR